MSNANSGHLVVLGCARTPIGKFGGALRSLPLPELGAIAYGAAISRSGASPDDVDEVAVGVNFPGVERSVGRQVLLHSGIPEDRVAFTVDRACCSSLAAITLASRGLRLGDTSLAVAGGVDNLSRVPYFIPEARWGNRLGPIELEDQLVVACPHTGVPRAVQAGAEAAEYGIGRREQDEWALRSQQRYAEALGRGVFDDEIVPVDTSDRAGQSVQLRHDEPPRPTTSAEKLAALPTVYGSVSVTPGNAPDLSSGASALVLTSPDHVDRWGPGLATIEAWSMVSGPPQKIASIPASAARLAMRRARLTVDEIDVLEINEAFAAVPLVSTLLLADGDRDVAGKLQERTNVNGGSVAQGHPTGATGARLVMTTIFELRRRGGGTGLVTICGGIGEAEAMVVRVPSVP